MLPVDDGYASSGSMVYLDSKLSRTLEATLVTYMPGDAWGKVLKVNSRELYDEHAGDYDSHCGEWNGQLRALGQLEVKFSPFPPFDIWVGIESVAGETLRRYHEKAWYAQGRDVERNIELQQGRLNGDPNSSDHTHATVKNFYQGGVGGEKAMAVWDLINNRTLEVMTAVCVTSTGAGAYAHAANSLKIVRGDTMGVCYTDNWPTSAEVLRVLWDMSHGRLDIWHWMCRLSKLLRDWHCDYGAALAAMSWAVYKWNKEDIIAVEDALENGTLDGTNKGKGHSPEETKAMKDSGKFYRLYVVYIRKTVRPASVIRRKMVEWKAKYTDAVDPKIGLPLATPGFDDQFERCLGLVEHLVDVAGVDSNYAERPKPGSKHTLTRWRSSRGAKVETFHLASRHYANLGTNARATQALQMEGFCRDNADRREDAKQFVGEDGDESARALTRVAHYRPWVRRERNILAEKAGQPQPYPEDGKVRPADNGERFYYEYHLEQEKRDLEHGGMQTPEEIVTAGGCTCKECTDIRQAKAGATATASSSSGAYPPPTRVFRPLAHAAAPVAAPPADPVAAPVAAPPADPAVAPVAAPPADPAAAPVAASPADHVVSGALPLPAALSPPLALLAPAHAARPTQLLPLPPPVPERYLQQMQQLLLHSAPVRWASQPQQPPQWPPQQPPQWPPQQPPQQPRQQPPQQQPQQLRKRPSSSSSSTGVPKKKGKAAPLCDCGAVERTRQLRVASGLKSGPGGRNERHTGSCPAKRSKMG